MVIIRDIRRMALSDGKGKEEMGEKEGIIRIIKRSKIIRIFDAGQNEEVRLTEI